MCHIDSFYTDKRNKTEQLERSSLKKNSELRAWYAKPHTARKRNCLRRALFTKVRICGGRLICRTIPVYSVADILLVKYLVETSPDRTRSTGYMQCN